ncbi:MAG: TauD/TfdA family dioxygenase [Polyangiales bacterium]
MAGIAEAALQEDWSGDIAPIVALVDEHFHHISGQALTPPRDAVAFRGALADSARKLSALADGISCALRGGLSAISLANLGIAQQTTDTQRKLLYALSALMGIPSAAEPREQRVVWDVKATEQSGEYFATFSEHDGEAFYHTDTQYYAHPERYFLLYVVEPARCGGGALMMRHGKTLKQQLLDTRDGRDAVRVLSRTPLPFRIPSVFTRSGTGAEREFTHATVFGDDVFLRWRSDTIRKGLEEHPNAATPEVLDALAFVESFLRSGPGEHRALMPKDSLCVVDNHVALHGRTGFADRARHLIRIRFHEASLRNAS